MNMDAVNNENQQGQRKIIYVGGSDEEYMGGGNGDEKRMNVNTVDNVPTISAGGGNINATSMVPSHLSQIQDNNVVGGSTESTPSMTAANLEHQEPVFNGGADVNASINHLATNNNDMMYGGAKKKEKTPDNSDNDDDSDSDSDDESAASSISTTQLLNVDPVYFRLTKFLTCTDYNGETKNVTNVLNDILTEFKKMNIFLENISKK